MDTSELTRWAEAKASALLSGMGDRWRHVQAVASRACEVKHVLGADDQAALVAAAWLHDVGYAPGLAGSSHESARCAQRIITALVTLFTIERRPDRHGNAERIVTRRSARIVTPMPATDAQRFVTHAGQATRQRPRPTRVTGTTRPGPGSRWSTLGRQLPRGPSPPPAPWPRMNDLDAGRLRAGWYFPAGEGIGRTRMGAGFPAAPRPIPALGPSPSRELPPGTPTGPLTPLRLFLGAARLPGSAPRQVP